MAEEELRQERLKKLENLKEAGIDPYPSRIKRTATIAEFIANFSSYESDGAEVSLVGRIISLRGHGGIVFADLFDGSGRTQLVFKKGELSEELFALFEQTDQGDFISATGVAFTTKRGEKSLNVLMWEMVSKSLKPIPSEWYGVKDEDLRYRQRYLDILLNPELRAMIERRAQFWQGIRSFLLERGFLEVETPVLETEPGGADARPFITHHNALDMDVYLRISTGELWQKRLLVAGFEKVFEIGRIFRNEGMSYEHLQDYTQMEFYQAYADYREGMRMVKEMYCEVAQKIYGKTVFEFRDHTVDFGKEWEEIDFCQTIKKKFGIDPLNCTDEEAIGAAQDAGVALEEGASKARAIDALWKHVRKDIAGPAFLTGIPVYLEPLAKRSPEHPGAVERFQVLLGGSEIGKGYSELNDPQDQQKRFEEQQALREQGDEEAQRMDESFVEALEYGMPPALGFGVSERLFAFFEGKNVRETQVFPLMKPKK